MPLKTPLPYDKNLNPVNAPPPYKVWTQPGRAHRDEIAYSYQGPERILKHSDPRLTARGVHMDEVEVPVDPTSRGWLTTPPWEGQRKRQGPTASKTPPWALDFNAPRHLLLDLLAVLCVGFRLSQLLPGSMAHAMTSKSFGDTQQGLNPLAGIPESQDPPMWHTLYPSVSRHQTPVSH